MEIKISIEAPGLEGAIHTLAQVLGNFEYPVKLRGTEKVEVQAQPLQQPTTQVETAPPTTAVPTQAPTQTQPVQNVVPTQAPSYDLDQLARAASQLMDAGKRDALVQLLASFGVQALTELPKDQYGVFATKLRELGAKI